MVARVIWSGGKRDGAAISARALRGVTALAALGVGEDDVIAIMLRNEVAFLEAMLIARQAGCYSCPVNWHYKADEAGYILRDCGAKALIVHADLLHQIEGGVPHGVHVIGSSGRLTDHPLGTQVRHRAEDLSCRGEIVLSGLGDSEIADLDISGISE